MKRFTYILAVLLLAANSFAQGHFVVAFTGNGQDHMNIFLVTATIGGIALDAGDEIAAFDGTICCGKVVLMQPINFNNYKTFIDIKASRKDGGLFNGYTVGNNITYKFWDSGKNIEFSGITAEYFDSSSGLPTIAPTYSNSGSAFVKLTVTASGDQFPVDNVNSIIPNLNETEAYLKLKEVMNISTEVNPFADESDIKVYPNPTDGNVQLKFFNIPNAGTWITASDTSGKVIYKTLAANKDEYMNLKGNPPGIYFIKIDQKIPKTYKIILE